MASEKSCDANFNESITQANEIEQCEEIAETQYRRGVMYALNQNNEEAIKLFKKAADLGHANAQHCLGLMYYEGLGVEQNNEEAIKLFKRAADQGHADSQYNLGVMHFKGRGIEQNNKEAIKLFKRAADLGHANAQYNIEIMYLEGQGVEQSDEEAAKLFKCVADLGHADAQYNLGLMYLKGRGVQQSDEEAATLFKRAADQEHADARYNLGLLYREGRGVEHNDEEAAKLFKCVADLGHADAQYNLGWMYREGRGVERDYKKAEFWHFRAAVQGLAIAQYSLGTIRVLEQRGIKENDEKVFFWFSLAAARGYVDAQVCLGFLYRNGDGTKRDYEKAAYWFGLAAAQGNEEARHNLGWMYAKGLGVERDNRKAFELFNIAENQESNEQSVEEIVISVKSLLKSQRKEAKKQRSDVVVSVEQFLKRLGKQLTEEDQNLDMIDAIETDISEISRENLVTVHLNDKDLMNKIKVKVPLGDVEWIGEVNIYDPNHILMNGDVFSPSEISAGEIFKTASGIEGYKASGGTRNVGIYKYGETKICFKQWPEAPGFEILAYQVFKSLFSQESFKNLPIPKPKIILMNGQVFLVTKFMEGSSFADILEKIDKDSAYAHDYIFNLEKFQRLAIFHLLSVPEDCRPQNCLAKKLHDDEEYELVLIDNERSFGRVVSEEKDGIYTRTHSVLFCFYEMLKKPIEQTVYKDIVDGGLNIRKLLDLVNKGDIYLSALDEIVTEENRGKTLLRLPTDEKSLSDMIMRFNDFKRWVRLDKHRNLIDIFCEVSPEIASIYGLNGVITVPTTTLVPISVPTPELIGILTRIHSIDGGRIGSETPPSANVQLTKYYGSEEHNPEGRVCISGTNNQKLPRFEEVRKEFDKEFDSELVSWETHEIFWHQRMQEILKDQDIIN